MATFWDAFRGAGWTDLHWGNGSTAPAHVESADPDDGGPWFTAGTGSPHDDITPPDYPADAPVRVTMYDGYDGDDVWSGDFPTSAAALHAVDGMRAAAVIRAMNDARGVGHTDRIGAALSAAVERGDLVDDNGQLGRLHAALIAAVRG